MTEHEQESVEALKQRLFELTTANNEKLSSSDDLMHELIELRTCVPKQMVHYQIKGNNAICERLLKAPLQQYEAAQAAERESSTLRIVQECGELEQSIAKHSDDIAEKDRQLNELSAERAELEEIQRVRRVLDCLNKKRALFDNLF